MAKGLQWFYTKRRRFVQNLGWEEAAHRLRAEIEDALHVSANQGPMSKVTQPAERECIGNTIAHRCPSAFRREGVLMIPESVGPGYSAVDKPVWGIPFRDLGGPADWQPSPSEAVSDQRSADQVFRRSHDTEVEPGRSDLLEIFRPGKKFKD